MRASSLAGRAGAIATAADTDAARRDLWELTMEQTEIDGDAQTLTSSSRCWRRRVLILYTVYTCISDWFAPVLNKVTVSRALIYLVLGSCNESDAIRWACRFVWNCQKKHLANAKISFQDHDRNDNRVILSLFLSLYTKKLL